MGGGGGPILVIDDDEDYTCLLQVALEQVQVPNTVLAVHDGNTAIDCLCHFVVALAGEKPEPLPVLVMLDLKLPGKCGLEILQWMQRQPALAAVPVVVFTGIEAPEEKPAALSQGAASLFVKPVAYRDLVEQMATIRDIYLQPQGLKHAA